MYVSRSLDDNLYVFISINENLMLKDKGDLYRLFTDQELADIFTKVVSKKFLLQTSDLTTVPLESVATISQVNVLNSQQFTTYLIKLQNNIIEFPARIIFNYSFKFRYYRFLDEKLKNPANRQQIDVEERLTSLYKQIADYDEATVNYNSAEVIRDTEMIMSDYIDFRNYNDVKERVIFSDSETNSKSLLQQLSLDNEGYSRFNKIIVDKNVQEILDTDKQKLIEFYGKLVNSISDYDYKRFLNQLSISTKKQDEIEKIVSPEELRTNNANVNLTSEEGLFKKENTSLKIDESKDSANLFLSFVLLDGTVKPKTEEENNDYKSFLLDSFEYPNYFFKHVMKFKLEYLTAIDPNSMNETWEEINSTNINNFTGSSPLFCRINLKNKKYFDKVAYEYFILEA